MRTSIHSSLNPSKLHQQRLVVKYAVHMHPLTRIQTPDLLQRDPNSTFDITCQIMYTALPLFSFLFLNSASLIINIYWMGNHQGIETFAGVCFGTILANIFVYYIIQNITMGFNFVCCYFQEKEEVGFIYQKTLGITMLVCILATPILYFSDRAMYALGFDRDLVWIATNYIWALIPNFYLYAFYQTTTNYLQSQGVIYPPIIISVCSVALHTITSYKFVYELEMGFVGAAWSKNMCDFLAVITLYLYVTYKNPTPQSWVQWNIQATNNIHRFLVEVVLVQKFTFIQVMAFQIICFITCKLHTLDQISAHYVLSTTYIVVYFAYIAISHCINRGLSQSIEQNLIIQGVDYGIKSAKKKLSLGFLLTLILSSLIIINMQLHKQKFLQIFISDVQVHSIIRENMYIFYVALALTGFQVILLGIVKTLQINKLWTASLVSYYFFGIGLAITLGYYKQMGLTGIWIGWNIGSFVSLIFLIKYIVQIDWEKTFFIVRDKYKTIEENIRISKMEII